MKPSDVSIFRQLNYLAELKAQLNVKNVFEGLVDLDVFTLPNQSLMS